MREILRETQQVIHTIFIHPSDSLTARQQWATLSVVKQMEQMSISFKGVFCSSVFILGSMPLIMQTTFCKGVSFDPLSVSQY